MLSPRHQVLGIRYQVLGIRNLLSGIRYQVSGISSSRISAKADPTLLPICQPVLNKNAHVQNTLCLQKVTPPRTVLHPARGPTCLQEQQANYFASSDPHLRKYSCENMKWDIEGPWWGTGAPAFGYVGCRDSWPLRFRPPARSCVAAPRVSVALANLLVAVRL